MRKEEVTGGWRSWKMINFIIVLFSNTTVVLRAMRMRREKHVARMGEIRNWCVILVGKHRWTRPIGRPRPRSGINVKIDRK
jgi:hypothetical protein